jgi:TRAP-type transport system small permease protein
VRAREAARRGFASIDWAIDLALGLTVAGAALVMLAQVALRYLFGAPLIWAEEFAVLAFGWMTFLGAAYAQRTASHISVDTVRRLASPAMQAALDRLRTAVIAIVAVVLVVQGTKLTMATWSLDYPAMDISRGWLYAAVPVGFALVVVQLARRVFDREPDESTGGEATSS